MKMFAFSAIAVFAAAGSAMADINSINGLNLNSYESFRNPAGAIPSTLTVDAGPAIDQTFNGSTALSLGNHTFREIYPALTPGFSNRHIAWLSDNGGNSAYQLQAGESFHVEACFRLTAAAPYPVRTEVVGAPPPGPAAETGIWIHNPRVNDAGVSFIDEGGIWGITNGTSFSGGAAMDFFLFGEGNGNPSAPRGPIFFAGDTVFQSYTYYAPGYFGAGSAPGYEATVTNITKGISVSSGLRGFGPGGLNPGTTIGFRFQNAIFPIADTDITTELSHLRIIPTPGAAAVLGLGLLAAGRRRR